MKVANGEAKIGDAVSVQSDTGEIYEGNIVEIVDKVMPEITILDHETGETVIFDPIDVYLINP